MTLWRMQQLIERCARKLRSSDPSAFVVLVLDDIQDR